MTHQEHQEQVKSIWDNFQKCSEDEQYMLYLLAMFYTSIKKAVLTDLCAEARSEGATSSIIVTKDVLQLVEGLVKKTDLMTMIGQEFTVTKMAMNVIFHRAPSYKFYEQFVKAIRKARRISVYHHNQQIYLGTFSHNIYDAEREHIIALNSGNDNAINNSFSLFNQFGVGCNTNKLFFSPFDEVWFSKVPSSIKIQTLIVELSPDQKQLKNIQEYLSMAKELPCFQVPEVKARLTPYLIYQEAIEGKFEQIAKNKDANLTHTGIVAMAKGNFDEAIASGDAIRKAIKGSTKKEFYGLSFSSYYILALLIKKTDVLNIRKQVDSLKKYSEGLSVVMLDLFSNFLLGMAPARKADISTKKYDVIDLHIFALVCHWMQQVPNRDEIALLEIYAKRANENGYKWFELEFSSLLMGWVKEDEKRDFYIKRTSELGKEIGAKPIKDGLHVAEEWERKLDALLQLTGDAPSTKEKKEDTPQFLNRIVWQVDFERSHVQPLEQSYGKKGWTAGRNLALKRFPENNLPDGATEQDRQIGRAVKEESTGYWGGGTSFYIDTLKAVKAMVGAPNLFLSSGIPCELVKKEPEIAVELKNGQYVVRFDFDGSNMINFVKETPTRWALIQYTAAHVNVAKALGGRVTGFPVTAKATLAKVLSSLSKIVTVHSELAEEDSSIPTVDADTSIFAHLMSSGEGFKVELFVKPFAPEAPYMKPGTGRENVLAEIKGQRIRAVRNIKKEKKNLTAVLEGITLLKNDPTPTLEWQIDGVDECLQLLLEIQPLREAKSVILEWPKGEKFKVLKQLDVNSLSVKVSKENDWFGITGEIKVGQDMVLSMQQLMGLIKNSKGNFIEVADGQFIALTKRFQKRLRELEGFLDDHKGKLRFNPLAASAMEELLDGIDNVKTDTHWKKHLEMIREAKEYRPKVPTTFQAELRSYQKQGFEWLSQLSAWGVGACLADDMGLGKTIQAMAVLINRAADGPALVVAPSSVSINWMNEIRKFAPTLNPILFGAGDRKQTLDDIGAFDILVCSYGLLQQASDLLVQKRFATIILDEAQAIKNTTAKRTKAAYELQGDFKIITTGTPIENHLGELWSIINFINPGLLGTLNYFNERFANPIEKNGDLEKKLQLRRLVQPFILRRKKNEVLDELPSKTEITLTVQLSDEERAFYEALRQTAIQSLEESAGEKGNDARFKVLAEISRLRQACCHPQMLQPDLPIGSAKLELFGEVVEELLENGHKALVFSQFVKHLHLIEEYVKKKGINYHYLDGQTPLKDRERMMKAFQAGEGDLFLISLKAGGTGLNLTAADYVIHMDPWWNPAVEDQASDRAHRIGQQRPVTIYRLIAENTIEEKIVGLHATKRDLADSLLEGTDASGKLSTEELMNLIKLG
jgi:superfamily II DNA or RNA helicase